jgi:tellurite resistance protein
MGSDLSLARSLPLPKLEALVEVMFLAASADGELSAEERELFAHTVRQLADERIGTRLDELFRRYKQALDESDRETRLLALKKALPEISARRLALELAIQVTAVDGLIRTSERELILDTADALEVNRSDVANLVRRFER